MTDETTPDTPQAAPDATVETSELEAARAELAKTRADMDSLAADLLAAVPEHLRALIPEDLGAAAKIAWFKKARETGVFNKPAVPETDNRKPAITPKQPDISALPPIARIAHGYGK